VWVSAGAGRAGVGGGARPAASPRAAGAQAPPHTPLRCASPCSALHCNALHPTALHRLPPSGPTGRPPRRAANEAHLLARRRPPARGVAVAAAAALRRAHELGVFIGAPGRLRALGRAAGAAGERPGEGPGAKAIRVRPPSAPRAVGCVAAGATHLRKDIPRGAPRGRGTSPRAQRPRPLLRCRRCGGQGRTATALLARTRPPLDAWRGGEGSQIGLGKRVKGGAVKQGTPVVRLGPSGAREERRGGGRTAAGAAERARSSVLRAGAILTPPIRGRPPRPPRAAVGPSAHARPRCPRAAPARGPTARSSRRAPPSPSPPSAERPLNWTSYVETSKRLPRGQREWACAPRRAGA
jgi:hypothetical protein